jgi:hypothetical protein
LGVPRVRAALRSQGTEAIDPEIGRKTFTQELKALAKAGEGMGAAAAGGAVPTKASGTLARGGDKVRATETAECR